MIVFTGVIETVGLVSKIVRSNQNSILGIKPLLSDFFVIQGGSVSVNGACLTLEHATNDELFFTAVFETLTKTNLSSLHIGQKVNLERALKLGDRIEGHLVLGHVDGTATIFKDEWQGNSLYRTFQIPAELRPYCSTKGSIAIDGVSLTIASVEKYFCTVALIPFTLRHTTVAEKKVGDQVNIECDVLSRYVAEHLPGSFREKHSEGSTQRSSQSLLSLLESEGF